MAFGDKLGKIFKGIGSGLSFIPGPWSIAGAALGAIGGVAEQVAQKRQGEEEQLAQASQPQPAVQPDRSRPEQAQIAPQPAMAEPRPMAQPNTFVPQPVRQPLTSQEIASMLLRDV